MRFRGRKNPPEEDRLRARADKLRAVAGDAFAKYGREPTDENRRLAFEREDEADRADRGAYAAEWEFSRPKRKNPFGAGTRDTAIEKYREFHRLEPKKLVEVDCEIPAKVACIGTAKWVTYRSSKVDPDTLKAPRGTVDYIHEHDAGVKLYLPDDMVEGAELDTEVPGKFRVTALVKLGTWLGFGFEDEGEDCEAKAGRPMPDLYTTPDGRCLFVIQGGSGRSGRAQVLAMMWGGGLGVEARGIVG